jgi:two-component system cell cycle sensor histidine kinase/response regulator CckA
VASSATNLVVEPLGDEGGPFLRSIEEALGLGVYIWEPGKRVQWSVGMCHIVGVDPCGGVPSTIFFERVHPEDRARVMMGWEAALAGRYEPFTYRMMHDDGEVRWIRGASSITRDAAGNAVRMVGTLVDVTEQERSAEQLAQVHELLAATQRAGGVGTYLYDMTQRRLEWSEEMYRMVGRDPGTPVPPDLPAELLHPEDRPRMVEYGARVAKGEDPPPLLTRMRHSDGTMRWIESRSRRVDRPDGPVILGVAVDVTGRVELEAHLRHAAKMEAVGTLAAGVAHDFNNYLTVLAVQLETMRLRGAPSEDDVGMMSDAIERCSGLVRQLLTFARRQPFRPRKLDLSAQVRDVLRLFTRVTGPEVIVEVHDAGPLPVRADAAQLDGAVMNLLVNARDAIGAGTGRIVVELQAEDIPAGDPRLEDLRGGRYARLRIRDTGSGIATELLPRIFEPYFTTKAGRGGTGLGLAAVYGTVQQHEGSIQVRSEPGQGATFDVYLPLDDQPAARDDEVAVVLAPAGRRVLVVEDVAPVREAIGALLAQDGFVVATAIDGADALAKVRAGERYDLVLSDVVMPRLDGRALARELSTIAPSLPVILMSGYNDDSDDGGLAVQLYKPFSREQLHAAIAAVGAIRQRES